MTNLTQKVWGTTECLIHSPMFELHRLNIEPSKCCSIHTHVAKWNAFYILSGLLLLEHFGDKEKLIDTVTLLPGMVFHIMPTHLHRFATRSQSCECLEMYFTAPLSEDILRLTVGGDYGE